jgi:O-antigen ligase
MINLLSYIPIVCCFPSLVWLFGRRPGTIPLGLLIHGLASISISAFLIGEKGMTTFGMPSISLSEAAVFDLLRVNNLLAIMLLAAALASLATRNVSLYITRTWLGVFAFTASAPLLTIASANPHAAQSQWTSMFIVNGLVCTLPSLGLSHLSGTTIFIRRIIAIWLLAGVLLALVDPANAWMMDQGTFLPGIPGCFCGLSGHKNGLGMISGFLVVLALTDRLSIEPLGYSIFGGLCLILSQCKTAIAATIIAIGLTMICRAAKLNRASKLGILASLLSLLTASCSVAFYAAPKVLGNLSTRDADSLTSFTGRTGLWEICLSLFRKHPLFGNGISVFSPQQGAQLGLQQWMGQAHNSYIQALVEFGLLGALMMSIFLVAGWYVAIKGVRSSNYTFLGLLVFVTIGGCFESFLRPAGGHPLLGLFLVCLVASDFEFDPEPVGVLALYPRPTLTRPHHISH